MANLNLRALVFRTNFRGAFVSFRLTSEASEFPTAHSDATMKRGPRAARGPHPRHLSMDVASSSSVQRPPSCKSNRKAQMFPIPSESRWSPPNYQLVLVFGFWRFWFLESAKLPVVSFLFFCRHRYGMEHVLDWSSKHGAFSGGDVSREITPSFCPPLLPGPLKKWPI